MHGNTPYAGQPPEEASPDDVETLRTELAALTARTRALLPDEFVVGSELRDGTDGPQATIAVQPPIGNVVSSGVPADATDEEYDRLATELAAGAALQVKRAVDDLPATAG
jgi:hypothetical protein